MSTSAARANHLALVSTTSASKPPFLHRRGRLCYFKRKVNWHRPHSALNRLLPMSRIPAVSNLFELNT